MKRSIIICGILGLLTAGCATDGKTIRGSTDSATYTCPMHPDVRESKQGNCPICGMPLVKELSAADINAQSGGPRLQNKNVCMMNNKYFPNDQIPVEVDGKTYYGCCQGCVMALKGNRAIRYGTDPFTGEEVDKADAFIVLNPVDPQQVLYFNSEQNYLNYIKKT